MAKIVFSRLREPQAIRDAMHNTEDEPRHEAGPATRSDAGDPVDREHQNLLTTMRRLHDQYEISCGLQSVYDAGLELWIGDPQNGYYARRDFRWTALTEARLWLVNTAQELEGELRLLDDLPDRPFDAARTAREAREDQGTRPHLRGTER
jgi:hypothetical protein